MVGYQRDTIASGLIGKPYLKHAYGPSVQLAVGDLEVYHVVLVDFSLQDVSACADCIQDPFSGELPLKPLVEPGTCKRNRESYQDKNQRMFILLLTSRIV